MLSSAKIGTASWRYYTDGVVCHASEYYAGVGEAPGRWHGRGLGELGLAAGGLVSEKELEALFARGLHPTAGSRLGRAWRTDGVTGFDLTFSALKRVRALWALGDSAWGGLGDIPPWSLPTLSRRSRAGGDGTCLPWRRGER